MAATAKISVRGGYGGTMTFIEMIAQIGTKLDDASHVTFPLADKKLALNQFFAELYFMAAQYQPSMFVKDAADITLVSGTYAYNLPTDFGKLYAYRVSSQKRWSFYTAPLHLEFHHYQVDHSSVSIKGAYGIIAGVPQYAQIVIHHRQWTAGATLKVEYIPAPSMLTADTDIFPLDPMWHELLVLGACERLCENKIDDIRYPRMQDRKNNQMMRYRIWLNERSVEVDNRFRDHFMADI